MTVVSVRSLVRTFAFVLPLVVATIGSPSLAQGMRPPSAMRTALRPDFSRRDFTLLIEVLAVDAEQRLVVDAIFEQYETAFDAGARAAREQMTLVKPAAEDPELRESRRAMREDRQKLIDEMRARIDGASAADRQRIIAEYQERLQTIGTSLREGQSDRLEGDLAQHEEMFAQFQVITAEWQKQKLAHRERFVSGLLGVLREDQQALWPGFERRMRRERTIGQGRLSGETIDLIEIVRDLQLEPEPAAAAQPILDAYELRLDTALRERNAYLDETNDLLNRGSLDSDPALGLTIVERQTALHQAVRDVNLDDAVKLQGVLPPEAAARLEARIDDLAFPRVHRRTKAARLLQAAKALPGLDAERLSFINELEIAYAQEIGPRNEALELAIIQYEPREMLEHFERMQAQLEGREPETTGSGVDTATLARDAVGGEYVQQLQGILTPEEFERLPAAYRNAPASGAEFRAPGPVPGGAQAPAGGAAIEPKGDAVLERFDTNGDGHLDDAEKAAIWDELGRKRDE